MTRITFMNRLTFRHKIMLFVVPFIILIITVLVILAGVNQRSTAISEIRENAEDVAMTFATICPSAIMSGDYRELEYFSKKLTEDRKDVQYIVVRKKNGEIFAESGRKESDKSAVYNVALPIGKDMGTVEIGYSLRKLESRLWRLAVWGIVCLAVFSSLAVAGSFIISGYLTSPVRNVLKVVKRISEGDFSERVKVDRLDELGELSSSFNRMADTIQQNIDDVNRSYARAELFSKNLEVKKNQLETLDEFGKIITSSLHIDKILNSAVRHTLRIMSCDRVAIYLLSDDGKYMTGRAEGLKDNLEENSTIKRAKIPVDDICVREAISKGVCRTTQGRDYVRLLSALSFAGKITGIIEVEKKTAVAGFSNADVFMVSMLSKPISIAVENAKYYEMAITDGLTGLYMSRYFHLRLEEILKENAQTGLPVSLLMTDIDFFKKFNDTYGHQTGDEVLKKVAGILIDSAGVMDIPCRYGGEEFSLIMPNAGGDKAREMAEGIRTSVEQTRHEIDEKILSVTISIGVSSILGAISKDEFIRQADTALYGAKEQGRNRVVVYG